MIFLARWVELRLKLLLRQWVWERQELGLRLLLRQNWELLMQDAGLLLESELLLLKLEERSLLCHLCN